MNPRRGRSNQHVPSDDYTSAMAPSDEIGDAARLVYRRMRIHHQPIDRRIKSIDYHSKIEDFCHLVGRISLLCLLAVMVAETYRGEL